MTTSAELPAYAPFVDELAQADVFDPTTVGPLLDGRASAELRRLVPYSDRRSLGAFFTPHALAERVTESLVDLSQDATVVDTTCGAGDLLLAAQRAASKSELSASIEVRLVGVDLVTQFVDAARLRLALQAQQLGFDCAAEVSVGDGFASRAPSSATHLILNPPFSTMVAPAMCEWGTGSVNAAAVLLAYSIGRARNATQIHAVLPDVLRSGRRYRKWREWVDARFDVSSVEIVGRFDKWTDVDVFVLRGSVQHDDNTPALHRWTPIGSGPDVAAKFFLSVGSVVHYRDPEVGEAHPYLKARGMTKHTEMTTIDSTRPFAGRLHTPPFVAIGRTSQPGDATRTRATLILGADPIAVDNHLIVAQPRAGGVEQCRRLVRLLRSADTPAWLDNQIRCRHLTIGSIGSIPWS